MGGLFLCVFFFFFFLSRLSYLSFSNASSLRGHLDMTEYCGYVRNNPTVVVSNYWRRAC